jgi:hypothetical protein
MATRAGIRDAHPSPFLGEIVAAGAKAKVAAQFPEGSVLRSMVEGELEAMTIESMQE